MNSKKPTRAAKIGVFSQAVQYRGPLPRPNLSDQEKRHLDEISERARLLFFAQHQNGSGYYSDEKFRQFVAEYNNRILNGQGAQMPSSFQVMQDFVEPDDQALILKIGSELHYSAPTATILEVITSPRRIELSRFKDYLKEGVIYHLNVFGGLDGLSALNGDGLVLYGCAAIRRGSELSIMALLGRFGEKPLETNVPVRREDLHPDRAFLFPQSGSIDRTMDDLYDLSAAYPVVLLTRIDLDRQTSLVRYVLTERRDIFDVVSDDREMFTDLSVGRFSVGAERTAEIFDKSFKELQEYADVFAILPRLIQILEDFEERDDIRLTRIPTKLKLEGSKTAARKAKKKLASDEARSFVEVKVISDSSDPSGEYHVDGLRIMVEQKGYWRSLSPQQIGIGKNGEEVHGKTWVSVSESWSESFGFSPPENSENVRIRPSSVSEEGEVYVMRSAMHPHDVFKIGYTTSTSVNRAKQLQSTSGQPDQFNVVQSWHVSSPRLVEQRVHDILRPFRVNSSREFFKLPYQKIRNAIETAIIELEASIE